MDNWIIKIVDVGYKFTLNIFIFRQAMNGKMEILRGDVIETIEEGSVTKPSLELDAQGLQAFADALAGIGIKPQKGFIEGKLAGTEKHLEDMRKLVFKIK